jgi:hypothetical protein
MGATSDYMLIGGDSAFSLVLNRMDGPPEKPRELLLIMKEVNQVYDGIYVLPVGSYRVTQIIAGPYDPVFGRSGGKESAGTGTRSESQAIEVKAGRASVLGVMALHHKGWAAVGYTTSCVDAALENRIQQKLSGVELHHDCLQVTGP